jgi:hypothetical protein
MARTGRWISTGLCTFALALATVGTSSDWSGASQAHLAADRSLLTDSGSAQSTWVDFNKDLVDPTGTYTQDVFCGSTTPAGQATLYPYLVNESNTIWIAQWVYHNNSTSGVTITPNNPATSDVGYTGLALWTTSIHFSGNYAMHISIECQSNYTYPSITVSQGTMQSVGSTSASVSFTISRKTPPSLLPPIEYHVQYGTKYATYTNQTPDITETLTNQTDYSRTVKISNLQPNTTYHYRIVASATNGSPNDASGEVGFYDFAQPGADKGIGTAPIVKGVATLTTPTRPLVPGRNPINASFTGDAKWAANDSNFVALNVLTPAPITLSTSATSVMQGQAPVLTVRMPTNATGIVGFYDFAQAGANKGIGTAPIINGVATLSAPTRSLVLGENQINASFGGDSNWDANDSNFVTVTVGSNT